MGNGSDEAKGEARLVWKGRRHRLVSPFFIGRSAANNIRLADAEVSRRHATIFEIRGRWWITDMGSRNGVILNGTRLSHARPLRDGDQIRIGGHALVFSGFDGPRSSVVTHDPMTEPSMAGSVPPSPGSVSCDLLIVSEAGEVIEGLDAARRLFGLRMRRQLWGTRPRLPNPLCEWVRQQLPEPEAGIEYEFDEGGRHIVVTLECHEPDRLHLLVREDSVLLAVDQLRGLGLTQREAEVTYWIREGKKNAEIAAILDVTIHTVNRHAEHVFKKLGVDSRQKAIRVVTERLGMWSAGE